MSKNDKIPDMDEMIKACKAKQKPDEAICFAVGAGRILPKLGMGKQMEAALEYIKGLEGFCGVHPVDLWHTLIIFDSLNNAKGGKNMMQAKGISTGKYIIPILVQKQFLEEVNADDKTEDT